MSTTLSAEAVVHAVFFYSPNCGHCHLVITEALLPLFEQYGEQLYIVGVDVLDGTPLLDIKPYVPEFDLRNETRAGWYETRSKEITL